MVHRQVRAVGTLTLALACLTAGGCVSRGLVMEEKGFAPGAIARTVMIEASRGSLRPDLITTRIDAPLRIAFTAHDATYRLKIEGVAAVLVAKRGETAYLDITPTRGGRFRYRATEGPGTGFWRMRGVIAVSH